MLLDSILFKTLKYTCLNFSLAYPSSFDAFVLFLFWIDRYNDVNRWLTYMWERW